MSTPYQKVQPHFPELSMKEVETLLGDTWDFYCGRDPSDTLGNALKYIDEHINLPAACGWSEEKWLYEINRLLESRRAQLTH